MSLKEHVTEGVQQLEDPALEQVAAFLADLEKSAGTTRQPQSNAKKAAFDNLASEWERATRLHSSIGLKSMHPAYQKIIGMGKDALPFIFERLQNAAGHWFWALTSITGEMPIPKEDLGQMEKMRGHWLEWGKRNGYVDASR